MTTTPDRCPFGHELPCILCAGEGCEFHRPDQMPCDCTVELRHQPTRGHGHVTSGGYVVGSIADKVQGVFQGTPGECTIRLVGGAGDGQEVDKVKTRGPLPPLSFVIHENRYERFSKAPGADGVWVYDFAPIPGIPHRRPDQRDPIAEHLEKRTIADTERADREEAIDAEIARAHRHPALSEHARIDMIGMPPAIEGRSGEKLPPGAPPPVQPSMGGAQPPPDEDPGVGMHWARHGKCAGVGCVACDNQGWTIEKDPQPRRQRMPDEEQHHG